MPEGAESFLGFFWFLARQRQWADGTPQPIPLREIEAASRMTGIPVGPDETFALTEMDRAWCNGFIQTANEAIEAAK
ncbi:MAG: hypothetical protein GC208_09740 [Alphaproteobacteria bacterium]|nr:hypothetical protein [Alphaproteobacteria bacterium]